MSNQKAVWQMKEIIKQTQNMSHKGKYIKCGRVRAKHSRVRKVMSNDSYQALTDFLTFQTVFVFVNLCSRV